MFSATRRFLLGCTILITPTSIQASGIGFSTVLTNDFGINSAAYASGPGFVNIAPGLNTSFADPSTVLLTTPPSMPLGLEGANMLLTTDDGGTAFVAGSIASGAIHTRVNAPAPNGVAEAGGTIEDTLTFHVAGGGSAEVFFTLSLDGSVGGRPWYTNDVTMGVGSGAFGWEGLSMKDGPAGFGPTSGVYGWVTESVTNDSFTSFDFTGTTTVTDGQVLSFTLNESLGCRYGTTCDFSNTLQTGLNLPAGVTFTSESGQFLAGAPEPGSMALIGCGIVALVARRKTQ